MHGKQKARTRGNDVSVELKQERRVNLMQERNVIVEQLQSSDYLTASLPWWPKVQDFLQSTDFSVLPTGRVDIDGDDLYAIVADDTARDEKAYLEAHRRYIDVQVATDGAFDILWKPLSACTDERLAYDDEKDFCLMNDVANTRVSVVPGTAVILFPEDAHAPQPPALHVRKVVVKASVSLMPK